MRFAGIASTGAACIPEGGIRTQVLLRGLELVQRVPVLLAHDAGYPLGTTEHVHHFAGCLLVAGSLEGPDAEQVSGMGRDWGMSIHAKYLAEHDADGVRVIDRSRLCDLSIHPKPADPGTRLVFGQWGTAREAFAALGCSLDCMQQQDRLEQLQVNIIGVHCGLAQQLAALAAELDAVKAATLANAQDRRFAAIEQHLHRLAIEMACIPRALGTDTHTAPAPASHSPWQSGWRR